MDHTPANRSLHSLPACHHHTHHSPQQAPTQPPSPGTHTQSLPEINTQPGPERLWLVCTALTIPVKGGWVWLVGQRSPPLPFLPDLPQYWMPHMPSRTHRQTKVNTTVKV